MGKVCLFLYLLLVSFSLPASGFDLDGLWYTEDQRPVRILKKDEDTYIAHTSIDYVDNIGRRTGEKIDYYFEFSEADTSTSPLTYQGFLRTFDSHYSCSFENGEASIRVITDRMIDVFLPKIVFKVKTVHRGTPREKRPYPLYCYDPFYHVDYVCGWDWRYTPGNDRGPIWSRTCEITERHTIGARLIR
ncbi:MAG: hypothetical protein KDD43_11060 [Bdellovibrionales bacterium]|nr:hypothetical protein [Bdellovibrionales bacterium]